MSKALHLNNKVKRLSTYENYRELVIERIVKQQNLIVSIYKTLRQYASREMFLMPWPLTSPGIVLIVLRPQSSNFDKHTKK